MTDQKRRIEDQRPGQPLEWDETDYLLGSPANATHLAKSIAQASDGEPVDLHNAIMNLQIPVDPKIPADAGVMLAYKIGHRDARHAAAELAISADATAQVPAAEVANVVFMRKASDFGPWIECEPSHKHAVRFAQSSTADKASEVRAAESLSSATDEAMQRAARDLPDFYEVRIELENGCGSVVWYEPDGTRHRIDSDGHFSDEINEAIDAALAHAAAPSTADSGNTSALGEGAQS